jgi:hypothetical protein
MELHIRDGSQEAVQDVQSCLEDGHSARLAHHSDLADLGEAAVAFDGNEAEVGPGSDREEPLDHRSNDEADGNKDPEHSDAEVRVAHRVSRDEAGMVLYRRDGKSGTHQACSSFEEKGEEKVPKSSFLSETWGTVLTDGGVPMTPSSFAVVRLVRPPPPFSENHP